MQIIVVCCVALFASAFAVPLPGKDVIQHEASLRGIEDRIVGGTRTTIQAHPYILSLRYGGRYWCGGSVLSSTRGLTSGHCLVVTNDPPGPFAIMTGSTWRDGDQNQQYRPLSRFLIHPDYDFPTPYRNDIGIVYWEEPLIIGEFVRAVALPLQGTVPENGKPCNVSGWGARSHRGPNVASLESATVFFISSETCNGPNSHNGLVTPDMLCAGLPQGGRDACSGDSGSPLVANNVLFGVVSWGNGCANPNHPGVYVRVPYFTDWIRENL